MIILKSVSAVAISVYLSLLLLLLLLLLSPPLSAKTKDMQHYCEGLGNKDVNQCIDYVSMQLDGDGSTFQLGLYTTTTPCDETFSDVDMSADNYLSDFKHVSNNPVTIYNPANKNNYYSYQCHCPEDADETCTDDLGNTCRDCNTTNTNCNVVLDNWKCAAIGAVADGGTDPYLLGYFPAYKDDENKTGSNKCTSDWLTKATGDAIHKWTRMSELTFTCTPGSVSGEFARVTITANED